MIHIRDAGNISRPASRLKVRDAGNIARPVSRIRIRDAGNVSRIAFSSLSVSANPDSVQGYGYVNGMTTITTNAATVTASGSGPFTYAWTQTGGDAFTITTPVGSSTSFQASPGAGMARTGYFRCTVTDSGGATAQVDVSAYVENYGDYQ